MRVATRSAVSRSVSRPIWSTMASILGFAGAASDCHRRGTRECASADRVRAGADRRGAAQRQRAQQERIEGKAEDMVGEEDSRLGRVLLKGRGGRRK